MTRKELLHIILYLRCEEDRTEEYRKLQEWNIKLLSRKTIRITTDISVETLKTTYTTEHDVVSQFKKQKLTETKVNKSSILNF